VLGGTAIGVGVGLAWTEIFRTTDSKGDSGMLVIFTCMPLGAMIGGLGGPFPVRSRYPRHIAIEREPNKSISAGIKKSW